MYSTGNPEYFLSLGSADVEINKQIEHKHEILCNVHMQ